MKILLTGGAGYIGSHTAVELLSSGYEVVIVDNFSNSEPGIINQIELLTDCSVDTYNIDITNKDDLNRIMNRHEIDCVIHLAGKKFAAESFNYPIKYYRNNIDTTLSLLECMEQNQINKIIFSSSAAVYNCLTSITCVETDEILRCDNPYGWSKLMNEQILKDAVYSNEDLSVLILRIFNPVSVHNSGLLGGVVKDEQIDLMTKVLLVATGKIKEMTVFGKDYLTCDGTCRRDFIHVMDLAEGIVKALNFILHHKGIDIFNLGSGNSYSVLEMIQTFEHCNNTSVPFKFGPKRQGDVGNIVANCEKAKKLLNWKARRTIEDMCRDLWNYQRLSAMKKTVDIITKQRC